MTKDDDLFRYYYDCENRLIDVNDLNDDPVASYAYDYLGRRVKKTVYSSPDEITKYCYDGDQVIAEYDYNDVSEDYELARKFIYGPGIDEPIIMIDVADGNTVYYYHFDGLGSVAALSNNIGEIVERYSYDVFGEPNRVSDVNNPYLFTGRRFDEETGLYYYRARYYAPDIGRFLQTDPIFYAAGLNLYTYVGNNPLNWVDPWGLWKPITHEILLRGVMEKAGFRKSQIDRAVRANRWVDIRQLFSLPPHYWPGTAPQAEQIIQDCLNEAVREAFKGNWDAAMEALGRGSHTVQDRYAHYQQDAGGKEHLPLVGTDPDDPLTHPEEFLAALKATEDYIGEFLRRLKVKKGAEL